MVGLKDEMGYELNRARTGRVIKVMSLEEKADDELIVNWIKSLSRCSFRKRKGEIRFCQLIKTVPIVKVSTLTLFRGRPNFKSKPNSTEFGPPPSKDARPNRYNTAGHSVLYLASSKEGVLLELTTASKVVEIIYCQQFCVLVDGLRIADFSGNDIHNFLRHSFDTAEHDDTYSFSQVLAKLVIKSGFDGMLVPGVRATGPNSRYTNVVLFTCSDWTKWIDRRFTPELISGSHA